MSQPFPILSDQQHVHSWAITPDASALEQLAKGIWDCAAQTKERPLVVLSTAGPLIGVRAALEKCRPPGLDPKIAFLPQVISFADWLEAAPGAWKFPKKQTDLERWLSVFVNLRKHKTLQTWFKAESEAGAWGLAQAVIDACDALSELVVPQLQSELNALLQTHSLDVEVWLKKVELVLDQAIAKAYVGLSKNVVDEESAVLLTFWRYLTHAGDPVIRKHLAMAAQMQLAKTNAEKDRTTVRPFIWVQTADPKPIDQELINSYLHDYAQFAAVVRVDLDWQSVALWPEALCGLDMEGHIVVANSQEDSQIESNIQSHRQDEWRLLAARRFEELAWTAAKSIESHLISGKKNIALVAQDRLAARRARALLSRLGSALRIRDETGWKLSTTRAAAALDSYLEIMRAPNDGYTIGLGNVGQFSVLEHISKQPINDLPSKLAPIGQVGYAPLALFVPATLNVNSTTDYLNLLKSQPNTLSYGSGGIGGSHHLSGALFEHTAGIDMIHAPYKSGSAASTDLMGGQVHMMFEQMYAAMPSIQGGRMRALAITSKKRSPLLPDLPTMAEAGVAVRSNPGGSTGACTTRFAGLWASALPPATVTTGGVSWTSPTSPPSSRPRRPRSGWASRGRCASRATW